MPESGSGCQTDRFDEPPSVEGGVNEVAFPFRVVHNLCDVGSDQGNELGRLPVLEDKRLEPFQFLVARAALRSRGWASRRRPAQAARRALRWWLPQMNRCKPQMLARCCLGTD